MRLATEKWIEMRSWSGQIEKDDYDMLISICDAKKPHETARHVK
jgi:hypothetical protein